MKKILWPLVSFLLVLSAVLAISVGALASLPPDGEIYQGIDVSKYQEDIDFEAVAAAGIQMVYIRSSASGDYEDPYFERNYEGAKAAGLLIGFYHSMTAKSVAEAEAQAEFFVNTIRGKSMDGRLAMDYGNRHGLGASASNEIALAFLNRVEALSGKGAMIYTDASGARDVWSQAIADRFPLWVAEYGVDEPRENGKWSGYAGWQYTDTGRVDGIRGNVDRDRFTSGALLDDRSPVPGPKPTPAPSDPRRIRITVARGDTLSRLAQRYHTTVAAIARLNDLENPNLIYVGQQLYIDADAQTAGDAPCYNTYTVRRGDTLWRIARRFNTTIDNLAAINRIKNPDLIFPGQVLELGSCRK